jgi:hypothetical protein
MFTPFSKGAVYTGQDPTGRGFIRVPVERMTPEQLAAWFAIDPATARRYFDPTKVGRYAPPKIDNAPGAPLPKLKDAANKQSNDADKKEQGTT